MSTVIEKLCTRCHETKSLEDFAKDSRVKNGRASRCKKCNRIVAREGKLKRQKRENKR